MWFIYTMVVRSRKGVLPAISTAPAAAAARRGFVCARLPAAVRSDSYLRAGWCY